jgi:hypothetical protein
MESEVQEAAKVPRSELDSAFDECRGRRWMVVQSMSTTPWGYVMQPFNGKGFYQPGGNGIPLTLGLSKDR